MENTHTNKSFVEQLRRVLIWVAGIGVREGILLGGGGKNLPWK